MDFLAQLDDWTDWDAAAFQLGRALGIFAEAESWFRVKHLFWSAGEPGTALHDVLVRLADAGLLERRDEPDIQFRRPTGPDAEAPATGIR